MNYQMSGLSSLTKIRLSGRFCYDDYDTFRGFLDSIQENPGHKVRVDLSCLESIDSAGIGMLIIANDRVKEKRMVFEVHNPKGLVQKVLEIAHLDRHFIIKHTPE